MFYQNCKLLIRDKNSRSVVIIGFVSKLQVGKIYSNYCRTLISFVTFNFEQLDLAIHKCVRNSIETAKSVWLLELSFSDQLEKSLLSDLDLHCSHRHDSLGVLGCYNTLINISIGIPKNHLLSI